MLDLKEIVSKKEVSRWNNRTQQCERWGFLVEVRRGWFVLMDLNGIILTECAYERIDQDDIVLQQFFYVRRDGKCGIFDLDCKTIIIPCVYDRIERDGIFFKIKMDLLPGTGRPHFAGLLQAGIADERGRILISPHYDDIETVFNIPSEKNKETENRDYGFLNRFIITKYTKRGPGIFEYEWPSQQALIDEKERIVLPYCDLIIPSADGCYICETKKDSHKVLLSFFDNNGKSLNKPIVVDSIRFCKGRDRFIIIDQEKKGIISNRGEIIAKCVYDTIQRAPYGSVVWATCDGRYVLVDIITGQYSEMQGIKEVREFYRHFSICHNTNDKVGLLDDCGKIVIPFEYDDAGVRIKDGVVLKKNGFWGAMSYDNKVIIPFQYDDIDGLFGFPFDNGDNADEWYEVAIIKRRGLFGLFCTDGKILVEPLYDEIIDTDEGEYNYADFLDNLLGLERREHVYLAKKNNNYFCVEIDRSDCYLKRVVPVPVEAIGDICE